MNIYKRFGISDSLLDSIKSITEKTLDPVDPKQAKGTFQARKDKDINNDGKVTGTDKYLHARRNAISKAMSGKKESKDVIDTKPKIDDRDISTRVNEQQVDEISKKTLGSYVKKAQMDKSFYAADMGRMGSKGDTSSASYDNVKRQHKNRGVGIDRAVDRLTKEDIEVQDTACTPIEEAVSVKKQNYSWGKMVTVHHGAETSYPLHPEHQAKIKALGDGEKTSFKDETKRTVTAQRVGDQIHLSGAGSSKKTPVARSHFTEEVEEIEELSKATLASYAKKASSDARFKQGIGKDYEALGKRKRDPETKAMFARMGRKVRMKAQDREKGAAKAIDRLAKEDVELTQEDINFINKLNNQ